MLGKLAFGGHASDRWRLPAFCASGRAAQPCRDLERNCPGRPSVQARRANGAELLVGTLEFTFTITTQQGNRFSGQSSDGKRTENLIGAISPNNKNGIVLDDDGQYLFTVRDSNTLDACYSHSNANSKVVSCYEWKRTVTAGLHPP